MSNSYISTSNVNVFPSALRTVVPDGKFTSENNITNILRTITTKDSFWIDNGGTPASYTIVIHGYIFNVSALPSGITPSDSVYAHILLDSSNRLVGYNSLGLVEASLDDSGNFLGLLFNNSSSAPSDTGSYTHIYLQMSSANKRYIDGSIISGTVPAASTAGSATTAATATKVGHNLTFNNGTTDVVYNGADDRLITYGTIGALPASNPSVSGSLTVSGDATINGDTTIKGDTILGDSTSDTTTVKGPLTANSTVTVVGTTKTNTLYTGARTGKYSGGTGCVISDSYIYLANTDQNLLPGVIFNPENNTTSGITNYPRIVSSSKNNIKLYGPSDLTLTVYVRGNLSIVASESSGLQLQEGNLTVSGAATINDTLTVSGLITGTTTESRSLVNTGGTAYSVGGFSSNTITSVKFANGKPTASTKIYFSTSDPSSQDGNNGDIWFKYTN